MTHTDTPTAVATIQVPEMRGSADHEIDQAALVQFLDTYRTHHDGRLADMAEQLVAYLRS